MAAADRSGSPHDHDGGWGRWENHVILELERLDNNVEALREKVEDIKVDVREVKVRSYIYGGVGGSIVVTLLEFFVWWATNR